LSAWQFPYTARSRIMLGRESWICLKLSVWALLIWFRSWQIFCSNKNTEFIEHETWQSSRLQFTYSNGVCI